MRTGRWKRQLFLSVLMVVFAGILITAFRWFHTTLEQNITETNYQIMEEAARQQLVNFETKIQGQLNQLQLYSRSFENVDMNDYKAVKETLNVTEGFGSFKTISVANETGVVINNNNTAAGNVMLERYYQDAMEGEASVSAGISIDEDGNFITIFAVPIYQGNKVIGALLGTMEQAELGESIISDSFDGSGATYIVNADGDLLLQSNNGTAEEGVSVNYFEFLKKSAGKKGSDIAGAVKNCFKQRASKVIKYSIKGEEFIAICEPVEMHDWYLILIVKGSYIAFQSRQISRNVYTLTVVVLASMLAVFAILIILLKHSDVLRSQAECDLLTNLLNKKTFERYVHNMVADRNNQELGALFIIDLDNFKRVNDTMGHMFGDKVLMGVADLMREVFRKQDYLGRIGGDEFAVYLSIGKIDREEALNVIKSRAEMFCKMLKSICEDELDELDEGWRISGSVGVSMAPEHGDSYEELYKKADEALYKAKNHGKDCFYILGEDD